MAGRFESVTSSAAACFRGSSGKVRCTHSEVRSRAAAERARRQGISPPCCHASSLSFSALILAGRAGSLWVAAGRKSQQQGSNLGQAI